MWPWADLEPFAAFGWEARGGYGDAYQTAQAFAVSREAAGVRIRQGANVTGLVLDGDRVNRRRAGRRHKDFGGHRRRGHRRRGPGRSCAYGVDVPIQGGSGSRSSPSPQGCRSGPVPGVLRPGVAAVRQRPELGGEILFGNSDLATLRGRRPGRLSEPAPPTGSSTTTVDKVGTRFPGFPDAAITGSYAGATTSRRTGTRVISATGIRRPGGGGRIQRPRLQDRAWRSAGWSPTWWPTGRSADPRIPETDFPVVPVRGGRPAQEPVPVRRVPARCARQGVAVSDLPLLRNSPARLATVIRTSRSRNWSSRRRSGAMCVNCVSSTGSPSPRWPPGWASPRR